MYVANEGYFDPRKLDCRLHTCRVGARARRALTKSNACSARCSIGAFARDNFGFSS